MILFIPLISITHPTNNTNHSIEDVDINYTISDINLHSCWYSDDSGVTNHTITCGNNITIVDWDEGSNTVYVYVNDSAGNENSTFVNFIVDTIAPVIIIDELSRTKLCR